MARGSLQLERATPIKDEVIEAVLVSELWALDHSSKIAPKRSHWFAPTFQPLDPLPRKRKT